MIAHHTLHIHSCGIGHSLTTHHYKMHPLAIKVINLNEARSQIHKIIALFLNINLVRNTWNQYLEHRPYPSKPGTIHAELESWISVIVRSSWLHWTSQDFRKLAQL